MYYFTALLTITFLEHHVLRVNSSTQTWNDFLFRISTRTNYNWWVCLWNRSWGMLRKRSPSSPSITKVSVLIPFCCGHYHHGLSCLLNRSCFTKENIRSKHPISQFVRSNLTPSAPTTISTPKKTSTLQKSSKETDQSGYIQLILNRLFGISDTVWRIWFRIMI